jgi:hypothetical protein
MTAHPTAAHARAWLQRYSLFDQYADLVQRQACSLADAVEAYLWELGFDVEQRRLVTEQLRAASTGRRQNGGQGGGAK